jgi:lambda family phage portal protein
MVGTLPTGLLRPTMMDRALAAVAPGFAMRRMQARAAFTLLGAIGGYTGARGDRRETKDWSPRAASADADQVPDLVTLRGRARDLGRNAPLAAGVSNTIVRNTIGIGLTPTPQLDRELLSLTDAEADAWERQAKRLWSLWAESTACDAEGKRTFAELQDIVCRSELESGDVFALRRYIERPGDVLGLKVQLVEADRVSNPYFQPDTDRLVGGIELDENGAPVRFYVANRHPDDLFNAGQLTWTPILARGPKTGERQVLHVYRALRPGQNRGVPAFAPIIEQLKQIDRYANAELMAAVVNSLFTVFVKQAEAVGDEGQGLQGLPAATALAAANELRLGHGSVVDLGAGESIEIAESKRPSDRFDPFFMACCKQIAVAAELPVEMVLLHFTASYSASRAGFQEAYRAFVTRRARNAAQFSQPCWEWVIAEGVARGILSAPGFFESPMLRAAWTRARWTGPVQTSLNPVDDAVADEKWIAMGVKTLDEVTAERTGANWEQNHRQRVKEITARRRDGLEVEPVAERMVTEPRDPIANPAEPGRADQRDRRDQEETADVA